jgi:2-(3-amino-3-carboxypropyl)histidine synthase
MRAARRKAVESARGAQHWGVVLGTLGRQGNPALAATLTQHLEAAGERWRPTPAPAFHASHRHIAI